MFRFFLPIFVLLHFLFYSVSAQTSTLEIIVEDVSGALIQTFTAKLSYEGKLLYGQDNKTPGRILFTNLKQGRYELEITSAGFSKFKAIIEVGPGLTSKNITLDIEQLEETVAIERSPREKAIDPRDGAFTNFLSQAEIDALPEDPEQLKAELKRKFGEDAEFFVDGFGSAKLPPKSQILSIKVSQTSFDAEYHRLGVAIIEITTKPAKRFFGTIAMLFNNQALNARPVFAAHRNKEGVISASGMLWGPIIRDRTSFIATVDFRSKQNVAAVKAITGNGIFYETISEPQEDFNLEFRIAQKVSNAQNANASIIVNRIKNDNSGVGGLNLSTRAFNQVSDSAQFKYSQSGNVGQKYFNEFRLRIAKENNETIPANREPTLIVLGAFNGGGAGVERSERRYAMSIANNLLTGIGNHALKYGFLTEIDWSQRNLSDNSNGTFIFTNLGNYLSGSPSQYTFRPAGGLSKTLLFKIGLFVQDDYRIKPGLMINLGLRYELQNVLNDKNNFSPRIGFSWSLSKDGKSTLRGGAAIFYDWLETSTLLSIRDQSINQPAEVVIINPGFPNPYFGSPELQILPRNFRRLAPDIRNPYIFLVQSAFNHRLNEKSYLRLTYTHNKVIGQFRTRDINAPINGFRPNSNFGRILQLESSGVGFNNSLKAEFGTTLFKSIQISATYKLSKSISDFEGPFSLPSDNYNISADRGPSDNDTRHSLTAYMYGNLPLKFNFSISFRSISPLPFNVTTGFDDNRDTVFNDRPAGTKRNSARGTWQNQTDFYLYKKINFAKSGKNLGQSTAGNSNVIERNSLQLGIEVRNLFNHTNFTNFVGVTSSSLFRQPANAGDSRRVELTARYSF